MQEVTIEIQVTVKVNGEIVPDAQVKINNIVIDNLTLGNVAVN